VHTILPLVKISMVAWESWLMGSFTIAPGNCSGSYMVWNCFSFLRSSTSFSTSIGFSRSIVATMFCILAFGLPGFVGRV